MQIFFNGAAHQLKTPLTSIIGYSQMIQVSEDSDEICEDAFVIEEAGEKLLKSINTLIADSRHGADVGPIQPTKVKFDELAGECLQLLKPRLQKLHIDCEIIGIKGACAMKSKLLRYLETVKSLNTIHMEELRGLIYRE